MIPFGNITMSSVNPSILSFSPLQSEDIIPLKFYKFGTVIKKSTGTIERSSRFDGPAAYGKVNNDYKSKEEFLSVFYVGIIGNKL